MYSRKQACKHDLLAQLLFFETLCYTTTIGNDEEGTDYGYKIHLIYGAMASPSEKGYKTMNESPEAITLSWGISTTPVVVPGFKPTASLTLDSTKITPAKMLIVEAILFGAEAEEARLPLPAEIITLIGAA